MYCPRRWAGGCSARLLPALGSRRGGLGVRRQVYNANGVLSWGCKIGYGHLPVCGRALARTARICRHAREVSLRHPPQTAVRRRAGAIEDMLRQSDACGRHTFDQDDVFRVGV